ncbi:MAG: leucyl aminopeptidase [Campylobacterota bacterium]|nr:leucyl aminopeptidase [Campylobacterota bacterium]
MNLKFSNQALRAIDSEITIIFVTEKLLENTDDKELLNRAGFSAKQDQICLLHEKNIMYCGTEKLNRDSLRLSATKAIRTLKSSNYTSAKAGQYFVKNAQAIIEGFVLGFYSFDTYKSKNEPSSFKELVVSVENFDGVMLDSKELETIVDETVIVSEAANFVRDLVNTIPNDITPPSLAAIAHDLAQSNSLTCNILDEYDLENENMNAMLAVGRASIHKPRLIHVSYKPENPLHVISLVGKGLTYDSGGLSLKSPTSMISMKMDKAGACAVLGIVKAVSKLKLPIEVHGFIGAAENMVAGNAYKPDDVLTAKNGTTIEVRNTDAEGRLVLADTLAYAQQEVKADFIFDYATLTGACMVALGPYTAGMMGHSHSLKHQFSKVSAPSGELLASLPFNNHLKKLLKSEIADISNVGSKPFGGAITAGMFLDSFIDEDMKKKWMHFDIAGPAYSESPWDCHPYGATGIGVRFTIEWMRTLLNNSD